MNTTDARQAPHTPHQPGPLAKTGHAERPHRHFEHSEESLSASPNPFQPPESHVVANNNLIPASPADLLALADAWIAGYWNAAHLRRAAEWVRQLDPTASPAVQLAALTHDMERAFPAPDAPVFDARLGPADPDYLQRHSARSAQIVGDWLNQQGAAAPLVTEVRHLIAAHETGGWPAADLLQAADSLSFLEVNVQLFLDRIPTRSHGVGPDEARAQFRYMHDRIRLPHAQALAAPLFAAAMRQVDTVTAGPETHR